MKGLKWPSPSPRRLLIQLAKSWFKVALSVKHQVTYLPSATLTDIAFKILA